MRAIAIIVVLLLTGACRTVKTQTEENCAKSETAVRTMSMGDSLTLAVDLVIDSPRIELVYIDTPRRVVQYSADRILMRSRRESVRSFEVDSTVATVENRVVHKQKETQPDAIRWWHWAAFMLVVVGLYGLLRRLISV